MNRFIVLLGFVSASVILRAIWKRPSRSKSNIKDQVREWENEGGRVLGVPPPHFGK